MLIQKKQLEIWLTVRIIVINEKTAGLQIQGGLGVFIRPEKFLFYIVYTAEEFFQHTGNTWFCSHNMFLHWLHLFICCHIHYITYMRMNL